MIGISFPGKGTGKRMAKKEKEGKDDRIEPKEGGLVRGNARTGQTESRKEVEREVKLKELLKCLLLKQRRSRRENREEGEKHISSAQEHEKQSLPLFSLVRCLRFSASV